MLPYTNPTTDYTPIETNKEIRRKSCAAHPGTSRFFLNAHWKDFPEFEEVPIYRKGQPGIKVVGQGYKLIQHKDLYNKFYSMLSEKIPYEHWYNVECEKRFSLNGAKMSAHFKFPSLFTEYRTKSGRNIKRTFHVYLKNAVDGEWSAKSGVGLMDYFCTNFEMGGEWTIFSRRHTSGFDLDDFVAPQVNYISSFDQMRKKHDHQIRTPCDDFKAIRYLQSVPKWTRRLCDSEGRELEQPDGSPVIDMNKTGDKLYDQWKSETETKGRNIFALSSALTYWASHDSDTFSIKKSAGEKNTLAVLLDRQEFVGKLLKESPFVAA